MVAQLQPGVQPHAKNGNTPFGIARRGSRMKQLSLVDKTHYRNTARAHRVQQLAREFGEVRHVVCNHARRSRRQIIEGHCDGPLGRLSMSDGAGDWQEGNQRDRYEKHATHD